LEKGSFRKGMVPTTLPWRENSERSAGCADGLILKRKIYLFWVLEIIKKGKKKGQTFLYYLRKFFQNYGGRAHRRNCEGGGLPSV